MQVRRLDHVNIQTTQVVTMVDWYSDILGLRIGPRPDFQFPGAWIYAGDCAVIHLVGHDGNLAVGSDEKLKLEHFALTAMGRADFEAKLLNQAIPYKRLVLNEMRIIQFHLRDPDGNHVHIDFSSQE